MGRQEQGVGLGISRQATALQAMQALPALERSRGWSWEEGGAVAVSLVAGAERPRSTRLSAEMSLLD